MVDQNKEMVDWLIYWGRNFFRGKPLETPSPDRVSHVERLLFENYHDPRWVQVLPLETIEKWAGQDSLDRDLQRMVVVARDKLRAHRVWGGKKAVIAFDIAQGYPATKRQTPVGNLAIHPG